MNRAVVLFVLLSFGWVGLFFSPRGHAQASSQGQWSAQEDWPTRAVHAMLLPDGRVFFISYYDESLQPNIWDPVTDTFAPAAEAPYALFCAGHTTMADGRIFIAGGHIADYTGYSHAVIYDPFQNTFTSVPDMNQGRWYPTTTVLSNGDILVVSGDVNSNTVVDPLPQVFQVASGTWRNLTSAQLMQALYPVMFVAPNGQVIYAGPEPETRYLDTSGTGAWTTLAFRQFSGWRDYGPGVMYDTGKILEVGGGDPPTATAETIDLTAATPAWSLTGNMHFPRRQENAVIMPDGKVFIVGGSSGGGFDDSTNPVLPTEMWDPATGQFTQMASIAAYHGYHSTALLLPDGRVVSTGGNVGGANGQVFSPPYLFAGPRPTISSAPTGVGYGQTVFIGTPDAANVTQVTWLRTASTTHTFDESARFMRLSFTQANGGLNVTMPANGNLAPPGYYMLFLLNSAGVPSVAKIIQITQAGGATGTLVGAVTNTSGSPLNGVRVTTGGASASTAADGTYTLTNVNAGSATVSASLAGYQSASQSATVTAGSTGSVPTIQLAPLNSGAIAGSVLDSKGNAISGASVRGGGLTAVTGSNGAFALNSVPAGSITLVASAPGFQAASETVTVTAGTTTTAPPLTLGSNAGSVTGKVTDAASGNPISGATVTFGGGSTTTASDGTYSFTNLPTGALQLVASATGFQSVTQNVTVTGGSSTTAKFSLPTVSQSPGTVTGVVTNISTGGVIAGAVVKWNGASATADGNGVYTLANVAGGSQTFTASATGYLPRNGTANVSGGTTTLNFQLSTAGILNVKVVTASGAAVSGAPVNLSGGIIATTLTGTTDSTGLYSSNWTAIGTYSVSSGPVTASATVNTGATTTITLTQQPAPPGTGTIAGTVTDSSGAAISGASVTSGSASATSQANGSYSLPSITAGSATVTASMAGFQTATQNVTVTAGATATANFSLPAVSQSPGTVTGVVTNISTGGVIAGAMVKWNGASATADGNGVYTLANVAGGSQTFTASATGYLARNATANVSGGTTTLNIQLSTAGILNVKVVTASGAAVSGAPVNLSGGTITTTLTGTTDSTGLYSSNWTAIGTYSVSGGPVTASATVNTGATTTITLTQQPAPPGTGTIAGTITDSSGAAISGASVTSGSASATSQANGSYSLPNITAGRATVTASMAGFQTATQNVTVTAGATATANSSLTAVSQSPGTVTGVVTNISTGGVIAGAVVKWNGASATADGNGVYTLSNVTSGGQTFTGSATGYLPRNATVTVAGGATSTLNFQLATAGIIKVTAKNASGAADVGATVNLQGGVINITLTGATNGSGVYSSSWIPIGSYTVTISQTGHATQSRSVTVTSGATSAVNFTF